MRLRLARERHGRGVPLAKAHAVLENLLEGMLRFWDDSLIDTEAGGYSLGHDSRGLPTWLRGAALTALDLLPPARRALAERMIHGASP